MKKGLQNAVKTLEKAIAAWEVVIRGFAINIPGMSSNDYTLKIKVRFMNSWGFSKKYCGCDDLCCNFAAGSSGPTLSYQADPSQGLKVVVKKAEMVFNFNAIKKYIGTPFLYSLFLREVGMCLGIGTTWGFLGITYSDTGSLGDSNTLRDLYSNADEATGLFFFDAFFFARNFDYPYYIQLEAESPHGRNLLLPNQVPSDLLGSADIMRANLTKDMVVSVLSVAFLDALGYTTDYNQSGLVADLSGLSEDCDESKKNEVCATAQETCESGTSRRSLCFWSVVLSGFLSSPRAIFLFFSCVPAPLLPSPSFIILHPSFPPLSSSLHSPHSLIHSFVHALRIYSFIPSLIHSFTPLLFPFSFAEDFPCGVSQALSF